MNKKIVTITLGFLMACLSAQAANITHQEQLDEARRTDALRQERLQRMQIRSEGQYGNKSETDSDVVSPMTSAFFINKIEIKSLPKQFNWLTKIAKPYVNKNIGVQEINKAVHEMNQELIRRGYVTCRVTIPEQNLSSKMLNLVFEPGYFHTVIPADGTKHTILWQSAFPIHEGDFLNVRLLEQGLEQMQRLSSQDVTMKLIPADIPNMTDVELTVKRKPNIYGMVSVDDSGLEDTGKIQMNSTLAIDNPLFCNDALRVNWNGDASQHGYVKGTRSHSLYYSFPYGRDTFTVLYSRNKYHQTVPNQPYDFLSSGKSDTLKVSWDHVLTRSRTDKQSMDVSVRTRSNHSYVDDMEIPIQKQNTTAVELGWNLRSYIHDATLYTRIGHRWGVSWFGAMDENTYPDTPRTHYRMWLLDMDFIKPLKIGKNRAAFTSSLHGQWTTGSDILYGNDMISIGNRYTVRGFDGEYTLMGESGWYLRNEVSSNIPQINSDVYLGLDVGAVYGPSTDLLVGKTIVGAALGLRGNIPIDKMAFNYDIFVGVPVYKPEGYHTKKVTCGFTASYRF